MGACSRLEFLPGNSMSTIEKINAIKTRLAPKEQISVVFRIRCKMTLYSSAKPFPELDICLNSFVMPAEQPKKNKITKDSKAVKE